MKISLSPSKLSLFKECPRCAWDAYVAKIPRPRGIFPSLPGGMDLAFKNYFDFDRKKMPPFLAGKVPGALMQDLGRLNLWRNWRTGLKYDDPQLDVQLIGALDDVLVDGDIYIPFDNKTRGSAPKDDGSSAVYYGTQIDCYELMLKHNGFKTSGRGFLCYYFPSGVYEAADPLYVNCGFEVKIVELEAKPERAKEVIAMAVKIMRGKRPDPSITCEFCAYQNSREQLTKNYGG